MRKPKAKSVMNPEKAGNRRRCQVRMGIAFVTGILVSTSMASWASFQYVGRPLETESAGSAGSSVYLPGPGAAPQKPYLQGYDKAFTHTPALIEKGAGIAWSCHGDGQGSLNKILYRLLPPGWSLYAKPGTLLDIPTWYACHGRPWTAPLQQVLHREGYTGTLWWGYNVLSIAPRPIKALPAVVGVKPAKPVIQPGGPLLPAGKPIDTAVSDTQTTYPLTAVEKPEDKGRPMPLPFYPAVKTTPLKTVQSVPDPVAVCHNHGVRVKDVHPAVETPLTIGPNGKIIRAGWDQRVINFQKAVREGWKLSLSKHPTAKEIRLARAWMENGGTLYYPLPGGKA
jgi:hypothetical protein